MVPTNNVFTILKIMVKDKKLTRKQLLRRLDYKHIDAFQLDAALEVLVNYGAVTVTGERWAKTYEMTNQALEIFQKFERAGLFREDKK